MAKVKELAVSRTENKTKLQLYVDGTLIDHTTITAAHLRSNLGQIIADSEEDPTDWDFTNPDFITVKLGLSSAAPGKYRCILVIKTTQYPTGLAWEDTEIELNLLP